MSHKLTPRRLVSGTVLSTVIFSPTAQAIGGIAAFATAGVVASAGAQAAATNVTATSDLGDNSTVVSGQTVTNIAVNWDVPAGSTSSTIEWTGAGTPSAVNSKITDSSTGATIGTIVGPAGGPETVTYDQDYLSSHTNVKASYTFSVGFKQVGTNGSTQPVTVAVDGNSVTPLHVVDTWPTTTSVATASLSGSNTVGEIPAGTAMSLIEHYQFNPVSAADVGKTLTVTQKIGDDAGGNNSTFDCKTALDPNTRIMYEASNIDPATGQMTASSYSWDGNPYHNYYVSGSSNTSTDRGGNPFQVQITSCTPDTLTYTWVPKAAGDTLGMYNRTVDPTDGNTWIAPYNLVQLTPAAIGNKVTGMYTYDATMDTAEGTQDAAAHGFVKFDANGGSGLTPPTTKDDSVTVPFGATKTSDPITANDTPGTGGALVPSKTVFADTTQNATGTSFTDAKGNVLTIGQDGSITVQGKTPGTYSVTAQVTDEAGDTKTETFNYIVSPPAAPTADPATFTAPYGTSTSGDLSGDFHATQDGATFKSAQFIGADGNPTNTITTDHGTYTIDPATGKWSVDASKTAKGADTAIKVRYTDSNDQTVDSTVTGTWGDPTGPTTAPDDLTVPFGTTKTSAVITANDTPGTGGALDPSKTVFADTAKGATGTSYTDAAGNVLKVGSDGTIAVTGNKAGDYSVTMQVTDAAGDTMPETFTYHVGAPTPPTTRPDSLAVPFHTTQTTADPTTANDTPGTGGALDPSKTVFADTTQNATGTSFTDAKGNVLTIGQDGKITVKGNTPGTYSVTTQVTDAAGDTVPAEFDYTVGEPGKGTAADDTFTVEAGGSVKVSPTANDKLSPDATKWVSVVLQGQASDGSLVVDGKGKFVPIAGTLDYNFVALSTYHGPVPQVPYTATDDNGETVTANISGTVTAKPVTPTPVKPTPVKPTPVKPAPAPHHTVTPVKPVVGPKVQTDQQGASSSMLTGELAAGFMAVAAVGGGFVIRRRNQK